MGLKKTISKLDSKYLDNFIHRVYNRIKNTVNIGDNFFGRHRTIVLRQPVADMILMQIDQNENGFNQYCAYDLAVRYLAIEEYYGKNEVGFELYKKMHTLGGNYGQVNEVENYYNSTRKKKGRSPRWGTAHMEQHSVEQFQQLLASIDKRGYDENSLVMNDRNLLSMNGSHRVTVALYNRMDYINIEIHNLLFQRRFSIDYFWERGFTIDEIALIEGKMESILQECQKRIGYYYCILFPPAEKYFDEITADINLVAKDNISVVEYQDYKWEVPDFVGFLKGVYYFDSILPKNFQRKLYYILRSSEIRNNKVKFRIVTLNIKHPMYRLKQDNGMPESIATVRLKEMIRGRYKMKEKKFTEHYVGDYSHDVIIHSSDNFISNNAFRDLLGINKDITEAMEVISKYNYAMAAFTDDKVSVRFPENYYMDEDFDIFVESKDLNAITQAVYESCQRLFGDGKTIVAIEKSPFGSRVRVTYNGFTVTMFDFMTQFEGIKQEYIQKFLEERAGEKIYYLSTESEMIYRTNKFLRNPSKMYHKRFLEKHKDVINPQKMLDAFDGKTRKKAARLWNDILNLQKVD